MSSSATFTIDEYQYMIARGAFGGCRQKRLELIRGELRMMSPQGAEHGEIVTQLNDWSHEVVDRQRIKIRIQSSVEIPASNSQPEPDVVWAEVRSYVRHLPRPRDIVLLVEVADHLNRDQIQAKADCQPEGDGGQGFPWQGAGREEAVPQ